MSTLRKQTLIVLDDDHVFHRMMTFANKPQFFKNICHYNEVDVLIDYLKKNKNNHFNLPDVIFVDIAIPVKDGWSFLNAYNEIRKSLSKHIIVYVVTASVQKIDNDKVSRYSFVKQMISKPITMEKFREIAA